MKYLLDSNIVIAASLGMFEGLRARMAACDEGDLATSAVVYAEVLLGSALGKPPLIEQLLPFLEEVPVLAFDQQAAAAYAALPFKRASYDRLIAAHAMSQGLVLVTDNERDFADIPTIVVENWLK